MLRDLKPAELTADEQRQLTRLLDRLGANLPEALAARERERRKEERRQEAADKAARAKERLNARLAELATDLDIVRQEMYTRCPSGVAFRHVSERLEALGKLVPTQSYFNTAYDTMDRSMIRLLAELALDMYMAASQPKSARGVPPLPERMEGVKIDVGQEPPSASSSNPTTTMAQSIIQAGKRRRGELP